MWFRGRGVSDTFRYKLGFGDLTAHAFSGDGSVAVALTRGVTFSKDLFKTYEHTTSKPPIDFRDRWSNLGPETRFSKHGFVVIREPSRGTVGGVLIPPGMVAGVLVTFAGIRYVAWRAWGRRRKRLRAGLCPGCGHDMGSFTERCPGCDRPRKRGSVLISRPGIEGFRHAA